MKSAGLKGTVSIELVHEAIHAAALRNMDLSRVLEAAKLDRDLLNAPRARVSAEAYSRMWVALADLMDAMSSSASTAMGCAGGAMRS